MLHPRALIAVVALLAGVTACQSPSADPESSSLRVVFKPALSSQASDGETGVPVGPEGSAPEIIVLADPVPETEARPETVRRPNPGPQIIYRTIYIEEAPETVVEDERPAEELNPKVTDEPIAEPDRTPVEPEPASESVPGPDTPATIPEPVATNPSPLPTTFPDGGSSRAEDAIVGAAVGASIGAILGGRDGALSGGIGGAIGGAMGGRGGGILGGVLGAGGRGRRGGGGCFVGVSSASARWGP